MVHRRSIEGAEVVFGVHGALLGNAMTFWDHDTGSIWSQPTGEAVAGPYRGRHLELLPVSFTTWDAWRSAHPSTLALDVPGRATNFALERLAIVVHLAGEAVAYPYVDLLEVGVVNDVVGGLEVAVVVDPSDPSRWEVLGRRLDDRVVTLTVAGGALVDEQTATTWDPLRGIAVRGPLAGEALGALPGFTIFPEDFDTFFPEGRLWTP